MPDQQAFGTTSKTLATPAFDAAMANASLLLDHAVRSGALPVADVAQAPTTLIADLIHAEEAAKQGRLTADLVIAFWIAYGRLSTLVKPVSAASLRACEKVSLAGMKAGAVFLVAGIILFSIFLFMSNSTATDTSELIDQQNAAALRLWSDMQVLRAGVSADTARPSSTDRTILTERVFEEMVEFSRKSSWLLESASRLNYWFIPPWLRLSPDPVRFEAGQKIDHLNISPALSTWVDIEREETVQIEAYQSIRNYAVSLYRMETLLYGSMSTYLLPTIYALLGAFLYGFRLYSRLIRRREYLHSAAHSARYFIAAMAGLVIGLFGSLLPKTLAMPPLAVAFLAGYAVEAFFSRLDVAIAKLKGGAAGAAALAANEAGGD